MGQMDRDFIPPYAVTMWSDDNNVYVALPMTAGGIPFITKYPLSEGGLFQALSVLRKRQKEIITPTIDRPANYTIPPQPMVKLSKAQERLHSETTPAQRESARLLLLKMGIK